MLAQILIACGAALWSILGTIHIIYTFFTNKLEPRDAATTDAMKATSPVLTRRTNLWNGWIGSNAAFGLGLLLFGATYHIHWCRYCHGVFPVGRIGGGERHAFAESAQIKRISGGADAQPRAGK